MPLLSAIAARTKRIRLGTGVALAAATRAISSFLRANTPTSPRQPSKPRPSSSRTTLGYMRTIAGEVVPAIYEGTELEEIGRRVHASATRIRYPDIARAVAKCGAPEPIAASIRDLRDSLGLTHYWSYFDLGGMPTPMLFRSMELFAKKVMPLVRG